MIVTGGVKVSCNGRVKLCWWRGVQKSGDYVGGIVLNKVARLHF